MAITLLPRTARGSQGKTAHPAMLNGESAQNVASVQSAVNAQNADGVVTVAGAQSAVANAATSMGMPMGRSKAEPTHRKLMRAVKVARNLAPKVAVKVVQRVEARAVGKAGASAGQTAIRAKMTPSKPVLLPTR